MLLRIFIYKALEHCFGIETLDLSEFCCLNEDCPDHGKKGKENIRIKNAPDEEMLRTLAMIPEFTG